MKLFLVRISPCCRAVWLYCIQNNIQIEFKDVDVFSGEHKTEEFRKLNPNCEVPVLVDGDVVIYEPCAILLYLAEKYTDYKDFGEGIKQQMMVKSMLSWASTELHQVLGYRVVYPNFMETYQLPGDGTDALIEKGTKEMTRLLEMIENTFLGRSKYLTGASPTIADYYVATILVQLEWLNFDFQLWPKITAWMKSFKESEHWKLVHEKHEGFVTELQKQP